MKTVGEILKEAREKKALGLLDIEKAIKIKEKFLASLERNDFTNIKEATVVRGFIKNYAEYLGLSSNDLLAVFRRDFLEDKKGQILPRGVYEPLSRPKLSWTPSLTVAVSIAGLFLLVGFYLFSQLLGLLGAPNLEIYSPGQGERVRESEIRVSGKTNSDTVVKVNGEMALVLRDGTFEKKVMLLVGENKITIEALSPRGKTTKTEKTVYFSP